MLPVSFELRAAGPLGQPGITMAQADWPLEYRWTELRLEFALAPWCKSYRQEFLQLILTDYAPHDHNRVGGTLRIADGASSLQLAHIPQWIHPAAPDSLSIWPVDLRPEWRPGITHAWLITHNVTPTPDAAIRRRIRRELVTL